MAATTWDANSKSSGVTLSNGNLTATVTSGTSNVAATRSLTGLTYFELNASVLSTTMAVGLVNRSFSFSSGTILGSDNNGIGFQQSGAVKLNNVTLTTIQTYTQGDTVCVAVRPTDRTIFFRTNAGNWNNSAANNPVTNTGGIDYSTMSLGTLLPAAGAIFATPNQAWIANFTGAFAQTAPSGFISADTCSATPFNSETLQGANYSQIGPVKVTPVTTYVQKSSQPVAAGAWYGGVRQWSPAATGKSISGFIKENGVGVAGREVRLDEHGTGNFLAKTFSASDGSYSFTGLNPALTYTIVAYDPTSYNAQVLDLVQGV